MKSLLARPDVPHDMSVNPYVARTLLRIDRVIYALRGKRTYWHQHLCFPYFKDGKFTHGSAVRSHFPGWVHLAACRLYRVRPFFLARFFARVLNL